MSRARRRGLAAALSMTLVAGACGGGAESETEAPDSTSAASATIDYDALGLWDDGPCDEAKDPLVIGLTTVFESPVLSLGDHALALDAAAEAFNSRGGANGACIEVHTCDDGGNVDQAVACVRELDDAGVVATVNDQTTAGLADVSAAFAEAGIPRVASNVTPEDWTDPNTYPLDASGTGSALLMPEALIEQDVKEIGIIRPGLAEAAALAGLLGDLYGDEGVTFPYDVPVAAGTTDYNQFILGAQEAGVGGITLNLGGQEGTQVVRAGQQLATDLRIGAALGQFSHATVADFGDFAEQIAFVWSYPPATANVPVYAALRDDLAASGEEVLQPENLGGTAMRSWIGLYALLKIIRDAGTTDFTREGITDLLNAAEDVPMLDMFGGEDWTPALNHPGLFQRAGINHWGIYRWDPEAEGPGGLEGNFVESAAISFDDVLCGSPFGAEEGC